jgi:hypothetical protein
MFFKWWEWGENSGKRISRALLESIHTGRGSRHRIAADPAVLQKSERDGDRQVNLFDFAPFRQGFARPRDQVPAQPKTAIVRVPSGITVLKPLPPGVPGTPCRLDSRGAGKLFVPVHINNRTESA